MRLESLSGAELQRYTHVAPERTHVKTWFSYEMTSEWVCVFVCRYWSWLQPESWPSRYPGTLKTLSRVLVLPVSMVAVLITHSVSPNTSSQLKGFSNQINKRTQLFCIHLIVLFTLFYIYMFFFFYGFIYWQHTWNVDININHGCCLLFV